MEKLNLTINMVMKIITKRKEKEEKKIEPKSKIDITCKEK